MRARGFSGFPFLFHGTTQTIQVWKDCYLIDAGCYQALLYCQNVVARDHDFDEWAFFDMKFVDALSIRSVDREARPLRANSSSYVSWVDGNRIFDLKTCFLAEPRRKPRPEQFLLFF